MEPGRVLVVEDEPDLRVLLEMYLRRRGFQVVTAASAEDALALGDSEPFLACLVDASLPGLSGVELIRTLSSRHSQARMILMSGYPAAQAGVAPGVIFLHKPFKPVELIAALEGR